MSSLARRKRWFERNEQAERLEAEGKPLEALRLYEENEKEGCDVAYTYERMATLYRSLKQYELEVRVLKRAVAIEERRGPSAQVIRLKKRLEQSEEVREREGPRGVVEGHEARGSTTRTNGPREAKKGCASTLLLLVTAVGTSLWMLL